MNLNLFPILTYSKLKNYYLYNYSIEDDYSEKIKNIIKTNKFEDFEHLKMEKQNKIKLTEII